MKKDSTTSPKKSRGRPKLDAPLAPHTLYLTADEWARLGVLSTGDGRTRSRYVVQKLKL